jgi:RND family efflux transporter MFP subunit
MPNRTRFRLLDEHFVAVTLLLSMLASGHAYAAEALETAVATPQVVAREQTYDAVVEAVKQGTVSAQTSGRVQAVYFDVDDYVPKDSVIVRFRDKEQQAGLQAAQAGVKEAEARFAEAQAEFKRIKDVFEKQVVPQAAFDKATADLSAAKQRLDAAQARMTQAQEQLDHTVVHAPYSGIVVKRHIEVGETANAGQALMTGFALDELRVTASVPQSVIQAIRSNNRARIIFPSQNNRVVEPKTLRIFPFADAQTHSYKVRMNLAAGQDGLLPGMFAKVAFVTGEEQRLLIPAAALVQRSELDAVYVIAADGKISFRQVRVGRRLDTGMLEVLAGLDAGERVALDAIRAGVQLKEQAAAPR